MRAISPVGAALLVASATASLLGGCDRKEAEQAPPIRPALVRVVQARERLADRRLTGTVQPRYEVKLGFQTTGRMVSRSVNVGDRIAAGQTLATLDPTVLLLAVSSSKADLANAQAALVNAQATFQRRQDLIRGGSVSQEQFDAAVAARDTAEAKVKQAQASLDKATEQLGYTALKSGYAGVVESWNAEVGQIVGPSQTAVTIARPELRDAVFDVPDDRMGTFAQGRAFTVSLLADPSITAQATVREIAPQSDAQTRTRRIRLTLDDAASSFRLGTTVTTGFLERRPDASGFEIPASAVVDQAAGPHVYVVDAADSLRERAVTLAGERTSTVLATSGLEAGERVLIAGAHSAHEGQRVKVVLP